MIYIQHASDKVLPFGSADSQPHSRLHPGERDLIIHKQHGNAFEDTTLHMLGACHTDRLWQRVAGSWAIRSD